MNEVQNKCLQYLKGYLKITIKGNYVERFLNMCRAHHIFIWKIEANEHDFSCCIFPKDFSLMIPFAKKTGITIKVTEKKGFPFHINFLKKKIIFLSCIITCLIMLQIVTNYVWAIEFIGNQQISSDELKDFIEQENIHYGMKKANIDCEAEEKHLREMFKQITWTSVYFQGTKLFIEIKENDMQSVSLKNTSKGSDLVSTQEGVITSIITRNGIPKVKAGDSVEKGQVLVTGKVPIYNEAQEITGYHIYDSDADIFLQTVITHIEKLSQIYASISYTGKEERTFFLEIAGYHIETPRLKQFKNCEKIMEKHQLVLLDNIYLPIYFGNTAYKEYYLSYHKYSKEDMKRILNDKLEIFILCLQEKGVQIIEKNVKISKYNNEMELTAEISLIKPIGESVEITDEKQQEE